MTPCRWSPAVVRTLCMWFKARMKTIIKAKPRTSRSRSECLLKQLDGVSHVCQQLSS